MRIRQQVIAGLAAIMGPAFSACAMTSQDESDRAQALIETISERDGIPGVMAAVRLDGVLVWSGVTGFADLEASVPLTGDTRMRIGSVSKPITAVLALTLSGDGLLDLDGDIRDLVPELTAPQSGAMTARHLAAHTSGVRQYDFSDYLDANNVFFYPTLSDALARHAADPLLNEPGEAHHYTSLGYNILGVAAERAGGSDFATLLTERVTGPLGMADTLIDHPLDIIVRRTRFYTRFPDGETRNTIWRDSSDYYPSGGILSTARDLTLFADAVFSGTWLDEDGMSAVTSEALTNDGTGTGYTFGWEIVRGDDGQVAYYQHGGETNGAYALVRYYPESRTSIAAIGNANHAVGEPWFFEAVGGVLPGIFGIGAD